MANGQSWACGAPVSAQHCLSWLLCLLGPREWRSQQELHYDEPSTQERMNSKYRAKQWQRIGMRGNMVAEFIAKTAVVVI